MKLKVNSDGLIIAFVTVGDLDDGQVFDGDLPDGFEGSFKPEFYKLVDGKITVNPDYVEPALVLPTGQTNQEQINAQLTKQLAATTKTAEIAQSAVLALTKQLAVQAKEA